MRYRNRIFAAIAALIAVPAAAQAPLTLPEALRLAVARSQQLVAQDASVTASREMAVAAGQLPDPMLKLGVDNLPVDGSDRFSLTRDFMTMRSVGVMQELTGREKRRLRSEHFELEAEKTLTEKDTSIAVIERDAALAWLDRYYAEAMAAVINEQIAQARLEIESAESAYRAGRGNQADIFASRSAVASLEDRASEMRRRIRTANLTLGRWLGDAVTERPLAGKPSLDAIRLDPRTLDTDLAHHPQIATMSKQVDIAGNEVRQAQANRSPDWSVELMYSQRGPAYSNMVSINVSVPLQWDRPRRQDRELASKLAMAEQMRAQREDMLRAHVAEARAMIAEWENDRERQRRFEAELVPLARSRTEAAVAAYRGGKASLAEVLSARRGEIEVRMQALRLEMDTARIWAQLNYLTPEGTHPVHAAMAITSLPPAVKDPK